MSDPELTEDQAAPGPGRNGHCAAEGHMKVLESGDEEDGLLESSLRLKPHEAQSFRRKALAVSWVSVVVTIALAIAAFSLLESSLRLKPHEAQSFRRKALAVSWVSVVVTIALAIAAFTVSFLQHSASAFGFAFDATLDVFSSVIVLWRYSNAAAVHSAHREYLACVVLGALFVVSSFCIMGKAVHDLISKNPPELDDFLFSVSILSGVLCSVLAVVKILLGRVLTSRALITDGFNSLVGAVMGFSILMSAEVNKNHPDVWFLDGTIGVFIGVVILAYGVKLLVDTVPLIRQTRNYEPFE